MSSHRKTRTSSRNLNTLVNTFPRDKQRTSVWKSRLVCSAPISSQSTLNRREFRGRPSMKLTILTAPSKTNFSDFGKRFEASCSRWMEQCVALANGANCFTRTTRPSFVPTMEAAPSVLMPTHLCQSKWFARTNSFKNSNMSNPVAVVARVLQKRDLRAHALHAHISRMSVAVLRLRYRWIRRAVLQNTDFAPA